MRKDMVIGTVLYALSIYNLIAIILNLAEGNITDASNSCFVTFVLTMVIVSVYSWVEEGEINNDKCESYR